MVLEPQFLREKCPMTLTIDFLKSLSQGPDTEHPEDTEAYPIPILPASLPDAHHQRHLSEN